MQAFLILGGALLGAIMLSFFPFIKEWWRSFFSSKLQATLISLVVYSLMVGAGSGIQSDSASVASTDRLIRAAIFMATFIASVIYIIQNSNCLKFSGPGLKSLVAYGILATSSAIYSIGPFISLWKGFEVLTITLATVALASTIKRPEDVKRILFSLNMVSLYLVLTVFVGLALYPDEAIRNFDPFDDQHITYFGVRGLVPVINPATQGAIAAILLVSTLSVMLSRDTEMKKDKIGTWIILAITITLILTARSRTQIIACSIASLLIIIYSRRYLLGGFILIAGAGAIFATSDKVLEFMYRGQSEEQFVTMTGRTDHWVHVIEQLSDSMVFGKGFYATQRILFGSGSVDNTYLECFVGLGLFGIIVMITPIIITLYTLFITRPRSNVFNQTDTLWLTYASIFSILFIRSFTSPTFASIHILLLYYSVTILSVYSVYRFRNSPLNKQVEEVDNIDISTTKRVIYADEKHKIISRKPDS